jgi:hypothetical protein
VTLAEVSHAVALSISGRRVDLVIRDHRVVVEVARGVLRVVWVGAPVGGGPATRDHRVPLDDADEMFVAAMVKGAIEEGLTPF